MIDIELDEEMEMPTPCQRCGKWFDLNDGYGSDKWYPNVVICEKCHEKEEKEIERDEEIEDAKNAISDAVYTINEQVKNLADLGVNVTVALSDNKVAVDIPEID